VIGQQVDVLYGESAGLTVGQQVGVLYRESAGLTVVFEHLYWYVLKEGNNEERAGMWILRHGS
jgi:hypothetical protein